jgi:hypothetical protein
VTPQQSTRTNTIGIRTKKSWLIAPRARASQKKKNSIIEYKLLTAKFIIFEPVKTSSQSQNPCKILVRLGSECVIGRTCACRNSKYISLASGIAFCSPICRLSSKFFHNVLFRASSISTKFSPSLHKMHALFKHRPAFPAIFLTPPKV